MTITATLSAQEKKSFTLDDLMPGGNNWFHLQPENLHGLQWWGDVCVNADMEDIKTIDAVSGKEQVIFTLQEANNVLEANGMGKIHHFRDVSFPYAEKWILVNTNTHKALIDWEKKELVWIQSNERRAVGRDWNKDSRSLAYTIDNNLYVTTADGDTRQVTDEPEGVVCGKSVHRNEFGIRTGTFWSPKGNLLAFYRMDESMVTDYPQVNTSTRIATLEPDKYPMAGMTSHKVTVGIYNPTTQMTIYLNAGDPTDRYFTNISWSPDEKSVYLIELNRDQNHAKLCRYDARTGELTATLIEETHPKYVEPQHPITFLPWDDNKFIYQSAADGYNHLYVCDLSTGGKDAEAVDGISSASPVVRQPNVTKDAEQGTGLFASIGMRQLTRGEWVVQDIAGFNEKAKEVIFMSTEVSPLQSNTFAVNVNTGKRRLIGNEDGMHNIRLSESGKYVIDNYTSSTIARRIDIVPVSGKGKSLNLLTATNPMEAYRMPEITVGTIKAADGVTDIYYRLVKPVDFDASKRYPAIIYVYGGPHAQMIHNVRNYGAGGWDIYMAQLGYVMLTVDGRGSDNRGLAFENCTFRQLGTEEMKDQIKGVELLKSLGYVDENRIGVHGWSFGGFMTTNLMLTYNDVFKVGVAGGPVINWEYYEVMYGERYMDTPQSNPDGYKQSNLTLRAGDLKGRLQIIIGTNDPTCVPQHTISFLRACIDAGTQPDFFMYPGDGHNMFGRDRVHLYERITRYFEDYLK